jgi:hypothetical protein
VHLRAEDAITSGGNRFAIVNVITPGQAVDEVIQEAQFLPLPENQTQILVGLLSRAKVFFNRGEIAQGCSELNHFIIKTESLHIQGYVDDYMIQYAQRIMAVLGLPIKSQVIMVE